MRENLKKMAEKSLKSFLKKKKVGYTVALLVAYLISGGIGIASSDILSSQATSTQEALLANIAAQKAEIEAMLAENEARLKQLEMNRLSLLNEGDWYSKPWYPSYFMSLEGTFTKADNEKKKWLTSDREDTQNDKDRRAYGNYSKSGHNGTGWIMNTNTWNSFTNVYDNEAKLTIIPVLTPPEVLTPEAPSVSFTTPKSPANITPPVVTAPAPITMSLNVQPATVHIPTVVGPTVPSFNVNVNDQNVNVSIDDITVNAPGTINIPTINPPVPSLRVSPATPPAIVPPNPSVTPPDSPAAPAFNVYIRKRGSWLYGVSANGSYNGFNNFDRRIQRWVGLTNTNQSINDAPFFNVSGDIYGKGKTVSTVQATTLGGVITNQYTDIASSVAAAACYPTNAWFGPLTVSQSTIGFPVVNANQYYSATDDGLLGGPAAGDTNNLYSNKFQQNWIFQGAPALVRDMTITVGGGNGGTAIFAQTTGVRMKDVIINMHGRTIIGDVDSQNNYEVNFNNVDINIKADFNTILALSSVTPNQHRYTSNSDCRLYTDWGVYRGDRATNDVAINLGTTNITAETSNNAIFYLIPASTHRWWGTNSTVSTPPNAVTPGTYQTNPGRYQMYYPSPGNIRIQNAGVITYIGKGNAGAWLASYVPDRTQLGITGAVSKPSVDLGTLNLYGDNNVGYYFADHSTNPAANAVFQGNLALKANMGTSLDGTSAVSQTQSGQGNSSGGDISKSEKNVALYIASGQRTDMNTLKNGYAQFYPATLSFTVDTTLHGGNIVGIANGSDIGSSQLGTNTAIKDPIKNFNLSNFYVKFGKYSKDSIAVVAKNGTIVEFNPGATISDNADPGAENNIMVYAEGVWWNPRKVLSSTYNKEAYGRGESVTGQKYISDFNTEVKVYQNVEMGSTKSTGFFAKNGAKITSGSNVTMNGHSSTGVFAFAVDNYAIGTIVDSNNANANAQPDTVITIKNITTKTDGAAATEINANLGAAAINFDGTDKGTGKVIVNVTGDLDITGTGAFARGDKATITVSGNNSKITSGENGALVAKDGGTVNFGGGTITHNVDDKLAFYSEKTNTDTSNINFTGATTVDIGKGIVFFGSKDDYSSTIPVGLETGRYTGMNNVTVNLTDHGVNLGVFENIGNITWDGNSTTYLNTLKTFPKVAAINDNGKWYKSSLEGANMALDTSVNRDSISAAGSPGDKFNDITFERSLITLKAGESITSSLGNTMAIASNSNAGLGITDNLQTGYVLNGKLDIKGGTPTTVGAYVTFGQIQTNAGGEIEIDDGVAAYGVNGSKIVNNGKITLIGKGQAIVGLSRRVDASGKAETTLETFGTDAGATGLLIDINNQGNIDIQGQDSSVAIYADNNIADLRTRVSVKNAGQILLGDNSVGVMVKGAEDGLGLGGLTGEGGQVFLTSTGGTDIAVGAQGMGVYGENSNIDLGTAQYTIETKEGGAAIYTMGNSNITGSKLKYVYTGNSTGTGAGLIYEGTGASNLNNGIDIDVDDTVGSTGLVTGIYTKSKTIALTDTLTNTGNITVLNGGAYGIVSEDVKIINTGTVAAGVSGGTGGKGIYLKNAALDTDGDKIIIEGQGAIGVYAKSTSGANLRDIEVKNGAGAMLVDGPEGVGVFVDDTSDIYTLKSDTNITLTDSALATGVGADRRIGIAVMDSHSLGNYTQGTITVGKNNIGIYNKNSYLEQRGTIDVLHNGANTLNIGIHALADGSAFTLKNLGTVNVNGIKNIGISMTTKAAGDTGVLDISGGLINVVSTSMANGDVALGVYGKGNGLTVNSTLGTMTNVGANGIGYYLEGDNTTTFNGDTQFNLQSDVSGQVGIGAHFKGGAYATGGTIEVKSVATAISGTDPVRPVGLYYSDDSTQNNSHIKIMAGSQEAIGMYMASNVAFTNNGDITIDAKGLGAYGSNTDLINNGDVIINTADSYGLYLKGGNSSSVGGTLIQANGADSIGVIAKGNGTHYDNQGKIESKNATSIGIVGTDGAYVKNSGVLEVDAGYGGVSSGKDGVTGVVSVLDLVAGSQITEATVTGKWAIGAIGIDDGEVRLNGGDILLLDESIGMLLNQGTGKLISGNIVVGREGIGVYAEASNVDLNGYTGTVTIGEEGTAIYSKDSVLGTNGTLDIAYTSAANKKGVGIYYATLTSGSAVTNDISITHTGDNLVNIYADDVSLTNTGVQNVSVDSIGIYGANNSTISNQSTIDLGGNNAVGVYLTSNSILTDIGTIQGSTGTSMVGVYVNSGDVQGNGVYDFDVSGGIGMYLENSVISYNGTINVKAASLSLSDRTVGIYVGGLVSGSLNTNINVSGANAIGLYLEDKGMLGAANITYNGDITIQAPSTGDKGIGAYLAPNTVMTLGTTGTMTIGGTQNIGFYVDQGATLNVSGGTVTNDPNGIFAYVNGGTMNFALGSTPNIDYVNVIVSGATGSLINDTTITVGTVGLQGVNGATVTNTINGHIKSTNVNGMAMAGIDLGTTVTNAGQIELTGDGSIGLYSGNGAVVTSTGSVEVGKEGVGYYASTGGTINVSGTTKLGQDSSMMYTTGGVINYTGNNIVGEKNTSIVTITDASGTVDLNGKDITVGEEGTGIFVKGTGNSNNVVNIGQFAVGKKGTGIYLDSGLNETLSNSLTLVGEEAIGILTPNNGDITYGGTIKSTEKDVKGIVSTGTGNVVNNGVIELKGQSNIGIYGENTTSLTNNNIIEVGAGTATGSSVGIYGKNSASVANSGTIKLDTYGVGIYGEGGTVTNTGIIQNALGNNTGIYGKNATVVNSGTITLSTTSNGIYTKDGSISNSGSITVGNSKSAGLYGGGNSTVSHTGGTIQVGDNSVGLATDSGSITVLSGAQILAGEQSTYIYSKTGSAENYEDLSLNKYGVGMYTQSGLMNNYAKITVGESDVSTGNVKVSVGMATEKGRIENKGIIDITHKNGVGMLSNDGGTAINQAQIKATGRDSYGMQATKGSTLINNGTIDVTGDGARGMVAIQNSITQNYGTINVTGVNAEGIYVETGSTVENYGTITVDGTGRTGIKIGTGGVLLNTGTIIASNGALENKDESNALTQVGDITIDGPNISIDGSIIDNIGHIVINGPLDFGTVKLSGNGTNDYVGTISAETFDKGQFIVLSDVTQGSNKGAYVIQHLQGATNIPNNGNITGISQSVSYVVEFQKDPNDSNKISIILVKVPYVKMMEKTKAVEFGKGLDELYVRAVEMELKMFDGLDKITDDDELAATFENEIRGNEYANIQDRMADINEVFNISYENLKHDRLYSKDSLKIGLISSKGESKYSDSAIIDYDQTTLGFMAMKEYDTRTYGQKYGWHIGFAQNKFEFDSDSEETVYSLNLGMSYERILGGNDRLKWHSKGEITVNRHEMDRKIDISGSRYSNDSKYWSGMALWRNKVRYEGVTESGRVRAGIQGTMDLGYGKYFNIKESGDGMFLDLPATDMYTIRPGIGADVEFTARGKKGGKLSLIGKASIEYELGEMYDGPNRAKFKGTSAGYYDLEKPKKERAIGKIGAELKYETRRGNSVGFEVTRQEGRRDNTRYGVNFTIRLDK